MSIRIGITGKARSGKDTIGDIIECYCEERNIKFKRLAFASAIKEFTNSFYGITEEVLDKYRYYLNTNNIICYNDFMHLFVYHFGCSSNVWSIYVKLINFNKNKRKTLREFLQFFGTDLLRKYDENIHIKSVENKLIDGVNIITDVRFDNEAEFVRNGGKLIHVERPNTTKILSSKHSSEKGVVIKDGDYSLINSDLVILKNDVYKILEEIL